MILYLINKAGTVVEVTFPARNFITYAFMKFFISKTDILNTKDILKQVGSPKPNLKFINILFILILRYYFRIWNR